MTAWRTTEFTSGEQYIISQQDDTWVITKVGNNFPSARCGGFSEYGFLLNCGSGVGFNTTRLETDYVFNRNTLRFMEIYKLGYVINEGAEDLQAENTPFMSISKCAPF